VYAGVYPVDSAEFEMLKDAVQKLTLNDASVPVEKESSQALGMGFRYLCFLLLLFHTVS
jgi:translation elongation factor EF-4